MSSTRVCGQCGAEVSGYSAEGLCPNCMLLGGLDPGGNGDEVPVQISPAVSPSEPEAKTSLRYFGDYELLEEIARGGMGVVYKARQVTLNRIVAVKMILAGQLANAAALQRFLAEAEAAANLHHPNIVAIYEVGEHGGQHYFSMEYVEGQNLAGLVQEKPLAAVKAAEYVRKLAEAIQYAHEHGTLHRDLKPSNVLLDSFDQPRITDFGLAKQLVAQASPPASSGDVPAARSDADSGRGRPENPQTGTPALHDLTLSGQVLGTPSFMPPEQAAGQRSAVGPASDVYSLGAILYHLVTGRPPFVAESMTDTLRLVAEAEPVSPRLLNPGVPRDLETICLKCLEKIPNRRYASGQALADELGRFLRDEPIHARPVNASERFWRWCRRKPVISGLTATLIAVFAAGFVGVLSQWRRAEQHAENESAQRQRTEQANLKLEIQRAESLLTAGDVPDGLGQMARLLRQHPTNQVLAERLFSALNQRNFPLPLAEPLQHQAPLRDAQFSPDSLRVITASEDKTARVWDALTGQPLTKPLQHEGIVRHASFSLNGQWVVTASEDKTARVWDAQTGELVGAPLVHGDEVSVALFSPDGKRVVTGSRDKTACIWEASSGQLLATISHDFRVAAAEFAPDGQSIVTASGDAVRVWNAQTGEPLIKPFGTGGGITRVQFSPDGRRIAAIDGQSHARIWDARTGEPVTPKLSLDGGSGKRVGFSPDGLRLVTVSLRGARVWDARTGQLLLPALKHEGEINSAEFSADGRYLLTAAQDKTAVIRDAHSGEPIFEPIRHSASVNWARFSPDGQRVVTASRDNTARVWDIRRAAPLPVTFRHDSDSGILNGVHAAHFSPDGKKVLTASYDHTVHVRSARTASRLLPSLKRSGPIYKAVFSPDGQFIATATATVKIYDANSGKVAVDAFTPLSNPGNGPILSLEFSPDGRQLVTSGPDFQAHIWKARTGQLISSSLSHSAIVWFAQFSPDGQRVVTASDDGTARVWNAATGEQVTPPLRHDDQVKHARFAFDGKRVVTASADETARVWDAATGKELLRLRHHNEVVYAEFSPDGTRVVTTSLDKSARVWDSRTGQPLSDPLTHDAMIAVARFSPDGQRVITASWDRTARVWDARTGQPLTDSFRFGDRVRQVEFSPDGDRILAGSLDGTAASWAVPRVPVPVPDWFPDLAESLARGYTEQSDGTQPGARDELLNLKRRLAGNSGQDFFSLWGKWFFADRSTRTISAFSTMSVPSYVRYCTEHFSVASLREAARLAPTNGLILGRLAWAIVRANVVLDLRLNPALGEMARVMVKPKTEQSSSELMEEADFLSRRAVELAPSDADAWHSRADVLRVDQRFDEAIEAIGHAIALNPDDVLHWDKKGVLLADANRREESVPFFSKAIQLEEAQRPPQTNDLILYREHRRDVLLQLGRLSEAGVDNLLARRLPARDPEAKPELIDLSPFYNLHIGTGPNVPAPGLHHWAGVDFDVRGLVQVASAYGNAEWFPREVTGIPVAHKATRLHFLHVAIGGLSVSDATIGKYVIHYADGQQEEIPLKCGRELGPNFSGRKRMIPTRAEFAWPESDPSGEETTKLHLYKFTWTNPRPEIEVRSLDIVSALVEQAPAVIAITVE